MTTKFYWARLKPYNPKLGCLIRTYVYKSVMYRGGDKPDWYKVSPALATELRLIEQQPGVPRTEKAFDVISDEERARVDRVENDRRMAAMGLISEGARAFSAAPRQVDLTEPAPAAAVPPAPPVEPSTDEPTESEVTPVHTQGEIIPPANSAQGAADGGRDAAVPPPIAGTVTTGDLPRSRRGRGRGGA